MHARVLVRALSILVALAASAWAQGAIDPSPSPSPTASPSATTAVLVTLEGACASPADLAARLEARAPVPVVDAGGRADTVLSVRIDAEADGFRGTLIVAGDDSTPRVVRGATCDEIVAALVVVAALAVTSPASSPTPPATDPASTVARTPASETRPASEPRPSTDGERPRELGISSAPVRPRERHVSIGTGVSWIGGVLPDGELAAHAFVTVPLSTRLLLRASFVRSGVAEITTPMGSTEFRWTTGRVAVSTRGWAAGPLRVTPALGVAAGVLAGRGTDIVMASEGRRPWLAPEVALRARIALSRFSLELEGSLAAPLIRDRFFIAPATTVHEADAVSTGLSLSLAVAL